MGRFVGSLIVGAFALFLIPDTAVGHDQNFPIGGKNLIVKTKRPDKQRFNFRSDKSLLIVPIHDPAVVGSAVIVRGIGPDGGSTARIDLDPSKWKGLGKPAGSKGYRYSDKTGSRGGIRKVVYKPNKLVIVARGPNWPWQPEGPQDSVWVHFQVEQEWYCAQFGGDWKKNEANLVKAKDASFPQSGCPAQICGNGIHELGEACDDGNLIDDDECSNSCEQGQCQGVEFASTFEAIQATVFDNPLYGCTNGICHGGAAPQGGLDLTAGNSHANLVGVPSVASSLKRVEPGDEELSFLYEKLAAATLGTPVSGGSSMPTGGAPPLSEDHLEAVRLWTRGGAPEDIVVAGTEGLLDGCQGEPGPLTIPQPEAPGAQAGAQFISNPWQLPSQSENEVCFATYYDLTTTNLIPAHARFACPTVCTDNPLFTCDDASDCDGGDCVAISVNNPSGECFRYKAQHLYQDPQSHHAFIRIYLGAFDTTDAGWGTWTYKFPDPNHGLNDQSCDPLLVDPNLGYLPGCSSSTQEAVACLGSGPADLSNGSIDGLTGSATAPTFTGAGVPLFQQEFADGVYSILPMQGILVWNSHAFNLTSFDTTMSIYLNLFATDPNNAIYRVIPIFSDEAIFVQNVPPFTTREYCRTTTFDKGTRIFLLTSHMHRHGVLWRTWGPPNEPCSAPPNQSCGAPRLDPPMYLSTDYSDPINMYFDPPLVFDHNDDPNRTFLYCATYDNGSTPGSPSVKRQSTSPEPPLIFGIPIGPGGPCDDDEVVCLNGPNRGQACNADDSVCDSFPGAGDGICDACRVRGGVTTEDEMMILQGAYFLVE